MQTIRLLPDASLASQVKSTCPFSRKQVLQAHAEGRPPLNPEFLFLRGCFGYLLSNCSTVTELNGGSAFPVVASKGMAISAKLWLQLTVANSCAHITRPVPLQMDNGLAPGPNHQPLPVSPLQTLPTSPRRIVPCTVVPDLIRPRLCDKNTAKTNAGI